MGPLQRLGGVVGLAVLAACGGAQDVTLGAAVPATDALAPAFNVCNDRTFAAIGEGFSHWYHRAIALTLQTRYAAQDVLAVPGGGAQFAAGFYFHGTNGHGIEDERVDVFLDDCTGWLPVGSARTDELGTIQLPLNAVPLNPGNYGVRQAMVDGTVAVSDLWVLPRGTQMVVLDMDGTLTTSNLEIWRKVYEDWRKRKYVPKPITGARDVVRAWADKGFVPVYLTARPTWLAPSTREWRTSFAFPAGPIVFAHKNMDMVPGRAQAYKIAYLKHLLQAGYNLAYAYGNAHSDAQAYQEAGVVPEHTFIVGQGRFGSYAEHLDWVKSQPNATPP